MRRAQTDMKSIHRRSCRVGLSVAGTINDPDNIRDRDLSIELQRFKPLFQY